MSLTPVAITSPSWTIPSPQRAAFPIVCKQWVINSLSRISRMADLLLSDSLEWLAWTPVLENRLIRYRSSLALGFSSSRVEEARKRWLETFPQLFSPLIKDERLHLGKTKTIHRLNYSVVRKEGIKVFRTKHRIILVFNILSSQGSPNDEIEKLKLNYNSISILRGAVDE